jgi:hypothetical protein
MSFHVGVQTLVKSFEVTELPGEPSKCYANVCVHYCDASCYAPVFDGLASVTLPWCTQLMSEQCITCLHATQSPNGHHVYRHPWAISVCPKTLQRGNLSADDANWRCTLVCLTHLLSLVLCSACSALGQVCGAQAVGGVWRR